MTSQDSAVNLLSAAYADLGYEEVHNDRLLDASSQPTKGYESVWTEKGDWLALGQEIGAERLFFIENNPVIVFARIDGGDWEDIRSVYNRVWSMARPRLLFLSRPGELAVYDLAQAPPRMGDKPQSLKPLDTARSIAEVSQTLDRFRREEIESGHVFEAEKRFGDLKSRADEQIIHDLKVVRRELMSLGLTGGRLRYAHALIGRSIFIRYLEDRGILTQAYFDRVAGRKPGWRGVLGNPPSRPGFEMGNVTSMFPRVLEVHEFTYALFRQLAEDFNGDMFPGVDEEEKVVGLRHLKVIQDLMYGDVGTQKALFFHAYDFRIVPVELISSIYEEFYHEESGEAKDYGAYYTPPVLAEFVVSQTLSSDRLATNPRVLDPACGSGIFLVESFRRIVRHRMGNQRRRLRFDELRKIIREQIAGIDLNPEAVGVAAFSLYLAMLHYLDPPDILEQLHRGNRLPSLLVNCDKPDSLNVLLHANAFDMERIEQVRKVRGYFGSGCADVVVGNPPWGSPGTKDRDSREANRVATEWCAVHDYPVGDQERSQMFIWRTLNALRPGGIAGLLVSTGVFFKHHKNSVAFRKKWLSICTLDTVFNFAQCRHAFFKGVDSPFALVRFHLDKAGQANRTLLHWSVKRTKAIEGSLSIVLSRSDLRQISVGETLAEYWIWKVFYWGGHQDLRLIHHLKTLNPLKSLTSSSNVHQGYKKANQKHDVAWLRKYKSLPVEHFRRYGPLDLRGKLEEVPQRVEHPGVEELYHGPRLLVRRGIEQSGLPKGQIVARFDDREFCFTHSIIGVKIPHIEEDDYKVILGIIWSSLARYYFFMTTGNWGIWHFEVELGELLSLPIVLPDNGRLKKTIISVVDALSSHDPPVRNVLNPDGIPESELIRERRSLEAELDKAIFALYGLGDHEIDLVQDMCNLGIDFFYRRDKSDAVKSATTGSPKSAKGKSDKFPSGFMADYLRVFLQSWSAYLDPETEMHWRITTSSKGPSMLVVVFTVQDKRDPIGMEAEDDSGWESILQQLDKTLPYKLSSRVYIDGLVRIVSDESIIIVKRNERRFWTRSAAREDAETTLSQAMQRKSLDRQG